MTGWRGDLPSNQPAEAPAGPCGPARAAVDERCAEADRLLQASEAHQHDMREARRQLDDLTRMHDGDARVRDRRLLAEQKANAQRAYDRAIDMATDEAGLRDAAALWLREIHELNRRARLADLRADGLAHELTELERRLPGLELAADTARIAAESAHAACTDARRALAACEEEVQRRTTAGRLAPVAPAPVPPPTPAAPMGSPQMSPWGNLGQSMGQSIEQSVGSASAQPVPSGSPAAPPWSTPPPAPAAPELQPRMRLGEGARGVLRGDRQQMLALALRLAEETGIEAGRLQLLLLELRASIATRALESYALRFPPDHPFWGQFPEEAAICVATSLGSMGYRYDGLTGWADGRSPGIRELALALSHCGFDHRSLRRPASQAAIDSLWEGTSVLFEEYLMREAPDLSLADLVATLGPHADRLGELWDIWGRLRPMLIEPA